MSSKPVSLSHHIGNGFVAKLVNIEPLAIPSLAPPPSPRSRSHCAQPRSRNLASRSTLLRKLVCPPFPLSVYFACVLCSKPPGRLSHGCIPRHINDE